MDYIQNYTLSSVQFARKWGMMNKSNRPAQGLGEMTSPWLARIIGMSACPRLALFVHRNCTKRSAVQVSRSP